MLCVTVHVFSHPVIPAKSGTRNRYTYGKNNPLRFKDDNGMWPTETHRQIIDKAFPNLSPAQKQILKNVSDAQDNIWTGGQANMNSYQHTMRNPWESASDAESQYNGFVDGMETEAVAVQLHFWLSDPDSQESTLSPETLAEFGKALHAITDSTSPAHEGFQQWRWASLADVIQHHYKENNPNDPKIQNAITAARNAFNNTFGVFGIQISDAGGGTTVITTQGDDQPCGRNTGVPCGK